VLADLPVLAVKVGMVGCPQIAAVIAERAAGLPNLVVDPVLVATSGSTLAGVDSVRPLLPYAQVLTPNRFEAGALLDRAVVTTDEMVAAAAALAATGPTGVVVTGSEDATDVLHHRGATSILRGRPVATRNSHGSGCAFSSAIAVRLAAGDDTATAVRHAKRYVAMALRGGRDWRIGAGPGPLDHFGWSA
jgi:hydroxymethylpyrimidine/phosphomethylpyrimidine kinase